MQRLDIEPSYRVVLPAAERLAIILVGVGGTGSTLALFIAGLAYHARQKGVRVALTLVDPDHIAPANVGRQACATCSRKSCASSCWTRATGCWG